MAGRALQSGEVTNEANDNSETEQDVTCDQRARAVRRREVWDPQQSQTAVHTDTAIQETIVGIYG
jgi:hypothetical protein